MQDEVQDKKQVESSWSRVKNLFKSTNDDPAEPFQLNPKFLLVKWCSLTGAITGLIIGGRIGAHVKTVEHIETASLQVYQSQHHAERHYQGKAVIGFVRNGLRYGVRAGFMSGMYAFVTVALNEVNYERAGTNYMAAGAFTGAVYNALSGWRAIVMGIVLGGGLTMPAAAVVGMLGPEQKRELIYGYLPSDEGIIERGSYWIHEEATNSLEDLATAEDVATAESYWLHEEEATNSLEATNNLPPQP